MKTMAAPSVFSLANGIAAVSFISCRLQLLSPSSSFALLHRQSHNSLKCFREISNWCETDIGTLVVCIVCHCTVFNLRFMEINKQCQSIFRRINDFIYDLALSSWKLDRLKCCAIIITSVAATDSYCNFRFRPPFEHIDDFETFILHPNIHTYFYNSIRLMNSKVKSTSLLTLSNPMNIKYAD